MTINTYNNSSPNNKVTKSLTVGDVLTGYLREEPVSKILLSSSNLIPFPRSITLKSRTSTASIL